MLKNAKLKPGQRVMDVGAGFFRWAFVTAILRPDLGFVGYEIVPERVTEAQRALKALGLDHKRLELKVKNLSLKSLKLDPADLIFAFFPFSDSTATNVARSIEALAAEQPLKVTGTLGPKEQSLPQSKYFKGAVRVEGRSYLELGPR